MKYRTYVIYLASVFLYFNSAFSQTFTLAHDSVQREYLVHVPTSYDGSVSVPLVVALHGMGDTPVRIENMSGLSKKSDSAGFIAVYPKGIATVPSLGSFGWNQDTTGLDDVGFISDMLDSLFKNFKIDTSRVYVTGFSIGGGMCYRLAQALSNRIAAIAPVSPFFSNNFSNLFPSKPVPIIQFKSQNDSYNMIFPIINYWINTNRCKITSDTILNQQNIIGEKWESQGNQAEIVLYSPVSAGHVWMVLSNGISATNAMWDFFQTHTISSSSPFAAIATINSPANGDIFEAPARIQLSADVAVVSGTVSKVEFYQNAIKIGEANSVPYSYTWTSVDTGNYNITIKVLDGLGNVMNPTPTVVIRVIPPNIAHNQIAYSSSLESTDYPAQNAIDGKMSTRWSSFFSDPQWLCIDLGYTTSIKGVHLYWEDAYGKAYKIQVSADLINWRDVYSTTIGDGGKDSISFEPVSARFVRMYGTQRGTAFGYSLYEFRIDTVQSNGVKEAHAGFIPKEFALHQNYPNPFNPSTIISYSIPKRSLVSLKIIDVLGREIESLVNEEQNPGEYHIRYDGHQLSSGIYFLKIEAGNFVDIKKCMLIK